VRHRKGWLSQADEKEILESLIERQLVEVAFEGSVRRLKVTLPAFRLLTKRGVGLNESGQWPLECIAAACHKRDHDDSAVPAHASDCLVARMEARST
jgi:hypothetical protein